MVKIIVLLICAAIGVYFFSRAKYSKTWPGQKNPFWGIKASKSLVTIGWIVLSVGVIAILYLLLTTNTTTTITQTQNQNNSNNTASSVTNDLSTTLTQQGYKVNSFESTRGEAAYVWWATTTRLATNIKPAKGFSFDITKSAPDDYAVQNMPTNSDIAKVIKIVNDYMSAHKIDLQSNQSSGSNPRLQSFTYTNSYFNSTNQLRCRVEIFNPDAGVGEEAPFRFAASFACADDSQYQAAYNSQLPYFDALTKYLSSTSSALYMLNPDFNQTCKNDPQIKPLQIYGIGESSINYLYVKKVNNVWVDSGLSGYQAGIHCG
jgi:hypothetical protein